MKRAPPDELRLGPDIIELLIPHRRPFSMVDVINRFSHGPAASISAARMISMNEPVFAGHFPGLKLWPGVYTVEGLAQTTNLMLVLNAMHEESERRGGTVAELRSRLANLDRGYRLHPGYRPEEAEGFRDELQEVERRLGMLTAIDVRLRASVFAGSRLEYRVEATTRVGDMQRCAVEASVDGQVVADGTLTAAVGPAPVVLS